MLKFALVLNLWVCLIAEQRFLQEESIRYALPLRVRSRESKEKSSMLSLLSSHHRLLLQGSPVLLEVQKSVSGLKNFFNTQFVAPVGIGSPPQYLDVILDTGSSNFWVNSEICKDFACRQQSRYDHEKSKEFSELGYFVEVVFGTGQVNGEINEDQVELAGILLKHQRLGEIASMDGDVFNDAKFSGILGLAFPSMAAFGFLPVFDSIMSNQALPSNIFTFYYSFSPDEESQVTFGWLDESKFKGDITWANVIKGKEYYWLIEVDNIRLGDKEVDSCKKGCRAAVDTGTTLIAAPTDSASKLLYMLNLEENCPAFEALPDLIFTISGRDFAVPARDYVLTASKDGSEDAPGLHSANVADCTLALMPMDIPKP